MSFFEALAVAWSGGFIIAGLLGALTYEFMRAHRERWWNTIRHDKKGYGITVLFYCIVTGCMIVLIGIVAALASVFLENHWLSALFYAFMFPSTMSRWIVVEGTDGGRTKSQGGSGNSREPDVIVSEESAIEDIKPASRFAKKLFYTVFGR